MKTQNLTSLLALAAALGLVHQAHAGALDVTLLDPDTIVAQGTSMVAFEATILNPSATDTIYLNGDSATTASTLLTVDDSPFYLNAPLSLAPGESSGPLELFDVDLSSTTPAGTYSSNTFSILGGPDGGTLMDFADLADATFSITVSPASSVPEPDSSWDMMTGLGLLAGLVVLRGRGRPRVSRR
jgi:hypothetical protein